jgi:hypothetical protein
LTAALTDVLLPVVRLWGFHRKSGRLIVRVTEGILQLMCFQRSGWGGGDFCVNCASMPLFIPHEYIVFEPGARLTGHRQTIDRWWPSATHEQADASMSEVVEAFSQEAVEFFDSTAPVAGLLQHMLAIRPDDHHYEFRRGACLARIGSTEEAIRRLSRAVALYWDDGRDWCAGYAAQAETLLRACETDNCGPLLDQWEQGSKLRLGISDRWTFDSSARIKPFET